MDRYKITNDGGEITMVDLASGVTVAFMKGEANTFISRSLGTATGSEYVGISGEMIDYAYKTGLLSESDNKTLARERVRNSIGQQIRQLRMEQGLSVRELADITGIGHSHITRIENGRYAANLNTLGALATALHADIALIPRDK